MSGQLRGYVRYSESPRRRSLEQAFSRLSGSRGRFPVTTESSLKGKVGRVCPATRRGIAGAKSELVKTLIS